MLGGANGVGPALCLAHTPSLASLPRTQDLWVLLTVNTLRAFSVVVKTFLTHAGMSIPCSNIRVLPRKALAQCATLPGLYAFRTGSPGPRADACRLSAHPPHHGHLLSAEAQSSSRYYQGNRRGCLKPQPTEWVEFLACQTHVLHPRGRIRPKVPPLRTPKERKT